MNAKIDTWQGVPELVAAVQLGSLSAAARRLGVSVSRVSRHLDALERRLGVTVLERSTRRLRLTAVGERYYERCVAVTEQIEQATREIQGVQASPSGVIRMTSGAGYVLERVAPWLARFARLHPRIQIHLDVTTRVVDLVDEQVDLALRFGAIEDDTLVARKLFERRLIACASPAYLQRRGAPEHPDQLREHDCVLGFSERWSMMVGRRPKALRVTGRWVSNNGIALRHAALEGLGIIYVPETLVQDDLDAGRLCEVLEPFALRGIPVWAVYPRRRRRLPVRVRLLLDYLEPRVRQGRPPASEAKDDP